jgi:sugar lactone lactonase YvrE
MEAKTSAGERLVKGLSSSIVAAVVMAFAGEMVGTAQTLAIRTLAGEPAAGATNGFGSNARFNHPNGIASDSAGNIYIADTENSTIRKITPNGFASTLAGLAGSYGSADGSGSTARFYGPQGIAADNTGQLFVADTANSTIRKIAAAGVVSTFAGAAGISNSLDGAGAGARFYHPEGLALDAGENLYVADSWNHTIRKITAGGTVSTLAGLAGNSGSADGTNSKARFCRPSGIAVDSGTNLYVADALNHTIRKITPAGNVSTIAGLAGIWGSTDGTNSNARFYQPQGICVAASGDIFVGDSGNQTLRKISPAGTNWVVSTVAGLSGLAGSTNGTGASAQFYFPGGIALDGAGYLYVADTANNTARTTRIVQPTLQSSVAGNQLVLSWPVSAEGFALEQSPVLGSGAAWSPATNGVVGVGDNFFRTNALIGTAFYRLHLP